MAKAQELAGDRMVEVAAGDVGGQVLAAGLVDEVRMDVVPVVFGSGKRYFGSVNAQHLLEDPDVVIQGNRVLHLRNRVRRWSSGFRDALRVSLACPLIAGVRCPVMRISGRRTSGPDTLGRPSSVRAERSRLRYRTGLPSDSA